MALQGVQGNLLNLLVSQDKNIKEFISTLNPGDTLKGRVTDILLADNKAVINFKGFNIVSQLPAGATLQKGDMINVQVTQVGDNVMMKLLPNAAALNLGNPLSALPPGMADNASITAMLSEMKLPVNEQNVYISRKLAEFSVPVTRENIQQVNTALISYMNEKGIDPKMLSADTKTQGSSAVMQQTLAKDAAASFITMFSKVSSAAETLGTSKLSQNTAAAIRQETGTVFMAELNKLSAIIKNTADIQVINSGKEAVITVNNASAETVKALAASLSGSALQINDAAKIMSLAVNPGKNVSIMSGKAEVSFSGGKLQINVKNGSELIAAVLPGADADTAPKIFETVRPVIAPSAVESENFFKTAAGVPVLKDAVSEIAYFAGKSVLNNTEVKQAAEAIIRFNVLAAQTASQPAAGNAVKQAAEFVSQFIDRNNINLIASGVKTATPQQSSAILEFAKTVTGDSKPVLPQQLQVMSGTAKQQLPDEIAANNASFQSETAIDAIAFLKSRNMPVENTRLIDIMTTHFGEGTKLNRTIENLNNAFGAVLRSAPEASNLPNFKAIAALAAEIRNTAASITINTQEPAFSPAKVEAQLKGFIESSGMNTENKLFKQAVKLEDIFQPNDIAAVKSKQTLPDQGPVIKAASDDSTFKDNLKTLLFRADKELTDALGSSASAGLKKSLSSAREAVSDALTNLNALQIMNQKPASFEMIYTQLPVLFENKIFNGELQVWYKKGTLKEQLNKAEPVNLLFVLNTSQIGTVKVSMTVYKNDVDCVIRTENEKAKQALMRGKNEFIEGAGSTNFNVKSMNVMVEADDASSPSDSGYVNLGKINMKA